MGEVALTWDDTREISFDASVVFGHGYDIEPWELMRLEAKTLAGDFAIWPNRLSGATAWSLYDATDGALHFEEFATDFQAEAMAFAIASFRLSYQSKTQAAPRPPQAQSREDDIR